MRRPFLPLILLGIGVLMLLGALGAGIHTAMFLHGAAHTTGTITDQTPVTSPATGGRTTVTYRPTITFQTADGHWVVVTSKVSTSSGHASGGQWVSTTPRVHEKVPVVYDPADATHAEVDSFFRLWLVAFIFGVLGAAFSGFGLLFSRLAQPS